MAPSAVVWHKPTGQARLYRSRSRLQPGFVEQAVVRVFADGVHEHVYGFAESTERDQGYAVIVELVGMPGFKLLGSQVVGKGFFVPTGAPKGVGERGDGIDLLSFTTE